MTDLKITWDDAPKITWDDERNDLADTGAVAAGSFTEGARLGGNPLSLIAGMGSMTEPSIAAMPVQTAALKQLGIDPGDISKWAARNAPAIDPLRAWEGNAFARNAFKSTTGLDPATDLKDEASAYKATGAEKTPLRDAISAATKVVGQSIPMLAIPGMASGSGLASIGISAVGAGAGQTIAGDTGALIGSILTPIVAGRVLHKATARANPPPTRNQLDREAAAAYDAANRAGVVFTPAATQNMIIGMADDMARQGLRMNSPASTGLYPNATNTLRLVNEELALGPMSLERMEILRRNINASYKDAVNAGRDADARLISRVKTRLDKFVNEAGPADVLMGDAAAGSAALRQARDAYHRSSKTETIETLIERAVLGKSKYTQSGLENSLRLEFRAFARRPREMRFFTPDERAAIRRVAEGSLISNALRNVGRFAIRGPISGGLGLGAAAVEPMAGITLAGLGEAGRGAATMMTKGVARAVRDMTARGYKYTQPMSRTELDLIRAAMTAAGLEMSQ